MRDPAGDMIVRDPLHDSRVRGQVRDVVHGSMRGSEYDFM